MICQISELNLYPVKSCRGVPAQSLSVSKRGVAGDRLLMLTRDGAMINQKEIPQLARVEIAQLASGEIEFRSEGMEPLRHSVIDTGDVQHTGMYFDEVPVIHQGDHLSQWISDVTGTDLAVVALAEPIKRNMPMEQLSVFHGAQQDNFADLAPILLTNKASLDALNSRLDSPVPMNRFRANVVVEGLDPWAEDDVAEYQLGDLRLVRRLGCERCAVTCTDQASGDRENQPLRELRSFRKIEGGYASGILFGVYVSVEGQGTLSVGDTLETAYQ